MSPKLLTYIPEQKDQILSSVHEKTELTMNTKIQQSVHVLYLRVRTPPKFSSGMTSSPSLACHRKFGPENNPLAVGRHPVPWLEVSCPKLQNEKQCVTRKNLGKKVWKLQQHSTQLANHKVLVIFSTKRKTSLLTRVKTKELEFFIELLLQFKLYQKLDQTGL